ncbi:hypothetical protein C0584_01835 [Candidatus Parcubacteria bacterium]|nr:MAG: hypothetical protein C0584_01835 [Candidatus Parcubacteria bacterium]
MQACAEYDECYFPTDYRDYSDQLLSKREIFRYAGYLIVIDLHEYSKVRKRVRIFNRANFRSLVRLAKENWEHPEEFDVDDLWNKEGNPTPYILIELGASFLNDEYKYIGNTAKIGTCFDRQKGKAFDVVSGTYADIITNINRKLIPLLAKQEKQGEGL